MSVSIYNIPNWAGGSTYQQHDIVKNGNYYYYYLENRVAAGAITLDIEDGALGGMDYAINGEYKPKFLWTPSYTSNARFDPKISSVAFGDGYEQRSPDGLFNVPIEFDLAFNNRKLPEATAILHFLQQRGGWESFLYIPPQPHNYLKRFVCRSWTHRIDSYNNYSIQATFNEVTN